MEGPGFCQEVFPGLRLSGVCEEHTAAPPSDSDQPINQPEWNECAQSAVEDLNGHAASNPRIRRFLNPVYTARRRVVSRRASQASRRILKPPQRLWGRNATPKMSPISR